MCQALPSTVWRRSGWAGEVPEVSVKVRLTGDLRRFADAEVVEIDVVELEGAVPTVGAVFAQIAKRYPRLGDQLFDEKGRLHYAVTVVKDGRRLSWPQERDEAIEDGGELLLTRFHSGG